MLRAFFAIALQDDIRQALLREISYLKENLPISIKWVKKQQLHLTLRFLGSITPNQVDQIINTLTLGDLPTFNLEFQHLVALPHHKPRIIGMGVRLSEELATLIRYLDETLRDRGFEPESRTFLPHITLGRIAKPKRKSLLLDKMRVFHPQSVSQITLYESQLSPEGSIYSALCHFPLKMKQLAVSS
jgi:RNA 2',3'-cyclic 3'-phosphodiesterase